MTKVALEYLEFELVRTLRGPSVILVFLRGRVEPVALRYGVFYGWGKEGGYRFQSYEIHVAIRFRRLGIASRIDDFLFTKHDVRVIYTHSAGEDGQAWMTALGYHFDEVQNVYYLTRDMWLARAGKDGRNGAREHV